MKSTVQIPIPPSVKLLVAPGSLVHPNSVLAETELRKVTEVIPITKILQIEANKIPKFLKKNIGGKVKQGEILIEKKSFLSTAVIKSPISGLLSEMDLKEGTLSIEGTEEAYSTQIKTPISGKIKSIGKNYIELETEAEIFSGTQGEGKDTVGNLKYLGKVRLEVLSDVGSADNQIIAAGSISADAAVKLEVLGIDGLVLTKVFPGIAIPWIQVSEEMLTKLESHNRKRIWLRPISREVVIW